MVIQMPFRCGDPHIAVLIPCHNEARSVGDVVQDFRRALPTSQIYVYDNNSSDDTVGIARAAGAIVRSERYQGKGNVVRHMFADIVADIYVMVDGDGTYDAKAAPTLVREVRVQRAPRICPKGHQMVDQMLQMAVDTVASSFVTHAPGAELTPIVYSAGWAERRTVPAGVEPQR
jgi:cellulose synthase/poly-beta-1,6-N-acetylglucosamine synthase-like glycosyltransferase